MSLSNFLSGWSIGIMKSRTVAYKIKHVSENDLYPNEKDAFQLVYI